MKTKNIVSLILALFLVTGCQAIRSHFDDADEDYYAKPPFYARYLNPNSPRDRQIQSQLDALKSDASRAKPHADLAGLLMEKGFPKDAEREYLRAVDLDPAMHEAWYNLAMVRQARGNDSGAIRAFRKNLRLKPGNAAGHFQIGLIEEKRGNKDAALAHYVKAYTINPNLLEVSVNPRILDTRLTEQALILLYPAEHTRRSVDLQKITYESPKRTPRAEKPPAAVASEPVQTTAEAPSSSRSPKPVDARPAPKKERRREGSRSPKGVTPDVIARANATPEARLP